jgi:hypothetical protein
MEPLTMKNMHGEKAITVPETQEIADTLHNLPARKQRTVKPSSLETPLTISNLTKQGGKR